MTNNIVALADKLVFFVTTNIDKLLIDVGNRALEVRSRNNITVGLKSHLSTRNWKIFFHVTTKPLGARSSKDTASK